MFDKMKLKKDLKKSQQLIETLEKKRYRSQAQLVEAILKNESPNDDDVEYFNNFTSQIDEVRDRIRDIQKQLDEL